MRQVLIVLAIALPAGASRADPATADRLTTEALARADAKDFLGAAAKFREAYAADPRPDLICNAGVAYRRADDLPRAQLYLSRCLERGTALDAAFLGSVRAELAAIETALRAGSYAPVDIVVDPRTATFSLDTFAPGETVDGSRTVWLPFGPHRVTARADGHAEQAVDANVRDRALVKVAIRLQPAAPRKPATTTPAGRPSALPAIATSVAVIGFSALAVVAYGTARDHADQAGLALDEGTYDDEADQVTKWNRIFGVSVALAGASAIASAYLWYRVIRRPVQIEATPDHVAFAIGGTF